MSERSRKRVEHQPFRARRTPDLFVMLGDDLAWVASMPIGSTLASGILARVESVPDLGAASSILDSYRSAPLTGTITADRLRRETLRDGLVTIEGLRVQSRFARFASVLAQAHGDVTLLVGPASGSVPLVNEEDCRSSPALIIRGAEWTLMIAPVLNRLDS